MNTLDVPGHTAPPRLPIVPDPRGEDATWLDALCRSYRGRLLHYAQRRFGAGAAEEIVQETLLRACSALRPSDRDPWPWLKAVLVNVGNNLARSNARRPVAPLGEVEPLEVDADPESHVLAAERDGAVRRALGALPASQRHLLWLHEVDGATCGEIAEFLGTTEAAVRVGLMRARRCLAREWQRVTGGVAAVFPFLGWARRWLSRVAPDSSAVSSSPALLSAAVALTAAVVAAGSAIVAIGDAPTRHQVPLRSPGAVAHHGTRLAAAHFEHKATTGGRRPVVARPDVAAPGTREGATAPVVSPPSLPKVKIPGDDPGPHNVVNVEVPTPVGTVVVGLTQINYGSGHDGPLCHLPVTECTSGS